MNIDNIKDYVIFCDFDGTITKEDTIDKLLENYAHPKWLEIEKLWELGVIGSKECLERQVKCIENISNDDFNDFVNSIELDEHFKSFYNLAVNKAECEFYIVSDGFDILIKKILKNNGLSTIKIFSNTLKLENGILSPSFPLYKQECESGSGVCKCSVVQNICKGKKNIYIGDGRSDMCASRHADVLFAKKSLIDHCKSNNIDHIPFKSFEDIVGNIVKEEILVKS